MLKSRLSLLEEALLEPQVGDGDPGVTTILVSELTA